MDGKPRILGVDSSLVTRKALEVVLRLAGYEVKTAADSREALALASLFRPALILLDASLGPMSSGELCRHLAAETATARIPIVLIAAVDTEVRQAFREVPTVVAYLVKPFTAHALTSIAADVLERVAAGVAFEIAALADDTAASSAMPLLALAEESGLVPVAPRTWPAVAMLAAPSRGSAAWGEGGTEPNATEDVRRSKAREHRPTKNDTERDRLDVAKPVLSVAHRTAERRPASKLARSPSEGRPPEPLARMNALARHAQSLRAQLVGESRRAKQHVVRAQAEAERSRAQAEQLRRANVELAAELEAAHSRLADLETESEVYAAEFRRLEQVRAQELAADAQRLAALEVELTTTRAQLVSQADAAAACQAELTQALARLREHTAAVEQARDAAGAERAAVQSTLDAVREQLVRDARAREEQTSRLSLLQATSRELTDRLAAAGERESELTRSLDDLRGEHDRQRLATETQLAALAERLADEERRRASADDELAAARVTHAAAVHAWQAAAAQREADEQLIREEWTQRLYAEQAQATAAQREAATLAERVAGLEVEQAAVREQRAAAEREVATARTDLTAREAVIEQCHRQLRLLAEQAAAGDAARRGLTERVAALQAELRQRDAALQAVQTEWAQRLVEVQARSASAGEQLHLLAVDRDAARTRGDELQRELAMARDELAGMRAALEQGHEEQQSLEAQVAAREAAEQELTDRVAALETELSERDTYIEQVERIRTAEADALHGWRERATQREGELVAAHEQVMRRLEMERANARALDEQVRGLDAERSAGEEQRLHLARQLQTAQGELAQGQTALAAVRAQVETLAGHLATREAVGVELADRVAMLEAEIEERDTRITRAEQLRAAAAETARTWHATAVQRQNDVAAVRAQGTEQLAAAHAQTLAARERATALDAHVRSLSGEREAIEQQRLELERELAAAQSELAGTRAMVTETETRLRALTEQGNVREAAARELAERTAMLEGQLRERDADLVRTHGEMARLRGRDAEETERLVAAAQAQVCALEQQLATRTAEAAPAEQNDGAPRAGVAGRDETTGAVAAVLDRDGGRARNGRLPNEVTRQQKAAVAFLTTKIAQIEPQLMQARPPRLRNLDLPRMSELRGMSRHGSRPWVMSRRPAAIAGPITLVHLEEIKALRDPVRHVLGRLPGSHYLNTVERDPAPEPGPRMLVANLLNRTDDAIAAIAASFTGEDGYQEVFAYCADGSCGFSLDDADFFPQPLDVEACVARLLQRRGTIRRLLLVSENAEMTTVLRRALFQVGCSASVTFECCQTMDLLSTIRPEVVLIDFGLARGEGLRLVNRLRSDPANGNLPLAVLLPSSANAAEFRQQALRAARDSPMSPSDLAEALGQRLGAGLTDK